MSEASARDLATRQIADFRTAIYDRAACREGDLNRYLTFNAFPESHRPHLRTPNVVEYPLAGTRLRMSAAERFKKTMSGMWMVHQVSMLFRGTGVVSSRRIYAASFRSQAPTPPPKSVA